MPRTNLDIFDGFSGATADSSVLLVSETKKMTTDSTSFVNFLELTPASEDSIYVLEGFLFSLPTTPSNQSGAWWRIFGTYYMASSVLTHLSTITDASFSGTAVASGRGYQGIVSGSKYQLQIKAGASENLNWVLSYELRVAN